jgi:hypothetical protein
MFKIKILGIKYWQFFIVVVVVVVIIIIIIFENLKINHYF